MSDQTTIALNLLREKRNNLIKQSDIYILPDYPHQSDLIREKWYTYRKQLRDLPSFVIPSLNNDGTLDETSFSWPIPPNQ